MIPAFLSLLWVVGYYAGLILISVWMLGALRRRGTGWIASLSLVVVLSFTVSAAAYLYNQQAKLRELEPLPPGVTRRVIAETWFGPLLVRREAEERGFPDGHTRSWVQRCEAWEVPIGGAVPTLIVIGVAWPVAARRLRKTMKIKSARDLNPDRSATRS